VQIIGVLFLYFLGLDLGRGVLKVIAELVDNERLLGLIRNA